MSQTIEQALKPKDGVPPTLADVCSPEWIAQVNAAAARDGHKIRLGNDSLSIEVLSVRGAGWMPLNLPNNTTQFQTTLEALRVLSQLHSAQCPTIKPYSLEI